jgi:hypothetical protein
VAVLAVAAATACSDGPAALPSPSPTSTPTAAPDPSLLPQVALIDEAIAALEAELGLPAEFYEINVTPTVVNMFVAVNNRTKAQPWAYAAGELASREALDAQGNVFVKDAVTFDEARVLTEVTSQLSGSIFSVFVIEGNAEGQVQYSVVVDSATGTGQLIAVVGPDGRVLSVDPV